MKRIASTNVIIDRLIFSYLRRTFPNSTHKRSRMRF